MEKKLNKLVLYIVFAQALLCLLVVIVSLFWYDDNKDEHHYLPFDWNLG